MDIVSKIVNAGCTFYDLLVPCPAPMVDERLCLGLDVRGVLADVSQFVAPHQQANAEDERQRSQGVLRSCPAGG